MSHLASAVGITVGMVSCVIRAVTGDLVPKNVLEGGLAVESQGYHLLLSEVSASCLVQVFRLLSAKVPVDIMLCGTSVIGARFVADELHGESLFPVFQVMRSVEFLLPRPRRALLLGLGAGFVPTGLRRVGIYTDVIEISPAVHKAALRHFGYDTFGTNSGWTRVENAQTYVMNASAEAVYDIIIHDLYSGLCQLGLFSRTLFESIRDRWLAPGGVLLLNFVGSHTLGRNGTHPTSVAHVFSCAVAKTLRSVFPIVRCYREVPLTFSSPVTNILCLASMRQWTIDLPAGGRYRDPPEMSPFWIVNSFQEWEVLASATNCPIIDNDMDTDVLKQAGEIIDAELAALVERDVFPNGIFWEVIKENVRSATPATRPPARDLSRIVARSEL